VRALVQTPELDVVAQAAAMAKAGEASKAREEDERLRWVMRTSAPTATRKVIGPENAIRKSETKRPRPTWPRVRRRSRASF
jgi:hypothetical protein